LLLTYMVILHPVFTIKQKSEIFEQFKLLEKYYQVAL
jgi:hypothetical protein